MKEKNDNENTIFGKSVYGFSENPQSVSGKLEEFNTELEQDKERKFVNLLIEIIVSATLKEAYEKGN